MQDAIEEEEEGVAFLPVVQQTAMAFREGNFSALEGGLAEILGEIRKAELWSGERATRARRLDGAVSRELGVDSMTTWLCPMLMTEQLAALAEELIEELSAAKKEEVLKVSLHVGTPPELLLSVGSHVKDWTMADGRFIWHGARATLKLLEASDGEVPVDEVPRLPVLGKSVLELGCGIGVVGLACARAGASRVLLTDYDDELLRACKRSVSLNGLGPAVWTAHLDWNSVSAGVVPAELEQETMDLVIGADIIYDADHAVSVLGTVRQLLCTGCAKDAILITGEPDRRQGVQQLDEFLGIAGWSSNHVGGQDDLLKWTVCRMPDEERAHRLYRFQLRPPP